MYFSKHLLHKITFLSFPETSLALIDIMALVLNILKEEIIEANAILENNVVAGVIMMTLPMPQHGPRLTKNTVFWWQNSVEDFE